jgi:serine protease AprX
MKKNYHAITASLSNAFSCVGGNRKPESPTVRQSFSIYRIFSISALLLISFSTFAQDTKFWVQFTDKNNTPYSLSNPSAYLSSRAIARRAAQGIAIDSTDLPVNPSYVAGVIATGATVHAKSKWFNGVVVFTNSPVIVAAIAALPYVASVSGVGARHADTTASGTKNEEETFDFYNNAKQRTGNVVSSTLDYGPSLNQIDMLGGLCLHNSGLMGQGMQIAVLDAGFWSVDTMIAFDSLRANNQILGTWDFVAGDTNVYEDNVHGMMVLSCMGGNMPGQIVGTAPGASYWLLRTEEAATEYLVEEYYWVIGAEYADSVGADVINSSLGYTTFDDPAENHSYADMDGQTTPCARGVNMAARKGIAVVVSAGNSGQSSWFYIGTPADADSAMAVAATDASGVVTGFSSRGPAPDGAVKPNVGAQGGNTVIASPGGGIQTGNGTSFASPVLCGLVACLWQAHPGLTNMQVLQSIEQSANQYSNPDTLLGYGIPDFCSANLILSGNPSGAIATDEVYGVYPNPFLQELHFSFVSTIDQELTVRLFDMQGRMLMDQQVDANGNSVNHYTLTELPGVEPGMYILQIKGANGIYTYPLIKAE